MRALLVLAGLAIALTAARGDAIIGNKDKVLIGINDDGSLRVDYRAAFDHMPSSDPTNAAHFGLRTWDATLTALDGVNSFEGWGAGARAINGNLLDECSVELGRSLSVDVIGTKGADGGDAFSTTALCGQQGKLRVRHQYRASRKSANLIEVKVTIESLACDSVDDIVYRRLINWDIDPNPTSEFVTIQGTGGILFDLSNNDGFCVAEPSDDCTSPIGDNEEVIDSDFKDEGPFDHGAVIQLALGELKSGEAVVFKTFYGAAKDEDTALAALKKVGASLFTLGQSDPGGEPATFMYGVRQSVGRYMPNDIECVGDWEDETDNYEYTYDSADADDADADDADADAAVADDADADAGDADDADDDADYTDADYADADYADADGGDADDADDADAGAEADDIDDADTDADTDDTDTDDADSGDDDADGDAIDKADTDADDTDDTDADAGDDDTNADDIDDTDADDTGDTGADAGDDDADAAADDDADDADQSGGGGGGDSSSDAVISDEMKPVFEAAGRDV